MLKRLAVVSMCVSLLACASAETVNQPHGLEDLMGRAQLAYNEGRMGDAERFLHQITESHPSAAPAWLRLGNVFYRTGRYDAAVHAYEQALRYEPKNGLAWHNLALTRMQQASAVVESGLAASPNDGTERDALLILRDTLADKIESRP